MTHNFLDRRSRHDAAVGGPGEVPVAVVVLRAIEILLNLSEYSLGSAQEEPPAHGYIGAESPSDWLLARYSQSTRPDQTLAAIEACRPRRDSGMSFIVGAPPGSEGETEKTLDCFIQPDQGRYPEQRS